MYSQHHPVLNVIRLLFERQAQKHTTISRLIMRRHKKAYHASHRCHDTRERGFRVEPLFHDTSRTIIYNMHIHIKRNPRPTVKVLWVNIVPKITYTIRQSLPTWHHFAQKKPCWLAHFMPATLYICQPVAAAANWKFTFDAPANAWSMPTKWLEIIRPIVCCIFDAMQYSGSVF